MKTIQRITLIALSALAIAAPVASARPASADFGSPAAKAQPTSGATIAAHHDEITQQAWEAAAAAPTSPIVEATSDDTSRFPLALVLLLAGGVPLSVFLVQVVGKSAIAYRRSHRIV